jgi:hypothetical protein
MFISPLVDGHYYLAERSRVAVASRRPSFRTASDVEPIACSSTTGGDMKTGPGRVGAVIGQIGAASGKVNESETQPRGCFGRAARDCVFRLILALAKGSTRFSNSGINERIIIRPCADGFPTS